MTARLHWPDEHDAPPPSSLELGDEARAKLAAGELPPAVKAALWRGNEIARPVSNVLSSGYVELDRELPGGGWPERSLTELLLAQPLTAELRLLAPAMRAVVASKQNIVLIGPPKMPHPVGLRDEGIDEQRLIWIKAETPAERLWVTEQLVKANVGGMVVAWLPQARQEQIRRLQVCAQACDCPIFLSRPAAAEHESSASPLRLQVNFGVDWEVRVHVLKRKGAVHDGVVKLASVPAGLSPLITPRLKLPSELLARSQRRSENVAMSGVVRSYAHPRLPAH